MSYDTYIDIRYNDTDWHGHHNDHNILFQIFQLFNLLCRTSSMGPEVYIYEVLASKFGLRTNSCEKCLLSNMSRPTFPHETECDRYITKIKSRKKDKSMMVYSRREFV